MNNEGDVAVRYDVYKDEALTKLVETGTALAVAHSVHVEITNLEADTHFYCMFLAGDYFSRRG